MFNRKPTTENALKGISKALDELNAVVTAEQAEVTQLQTSIDEAYVAQGDASARRDRAAGIAERFAALIA